MVCGAAGAAVALLAFAYATLSLRRLFQGEFIGAWRDFGQAETYAYSALWLVLGVALLVGGLLLRSQVLRFASGALIVVAVRRFSCSTCRSSKACCARSPSSASASC